MLVFEHMEVDLEALIKDASVTLTPGNIKAYMQTLLHALGLLHAQGVIHRDIKSNNLLVSAHGDLKLADFGLARVLSASDQPTR